MNEDATPDNKQPAYSGPMDGDMRLAAWRSESEKGTKFLSLKREPKQGGSPQAAAPNPNANKPLDDVVPF
jgi:hypothetical protein